MITAQEKFSKIQEINHFLQLANTLANRYEKQGRKEVGRAVIAATSAAAALSLRLLPVVTCPLHHKPLQTDYQLYHEACEDCLKQQNCQSCHTTYTDSVEIEHLLHSRECLLCEDIRADAEQDRIFDYQEVYE